MYDVNKTVLNIKKAAKEKNISTTVMLENLGLNKNTLSSMSGRGSWVKSDTLAKIADYLDVSVDYLLGRDVPYDNRPEFSTLWDDFSASPSAITAGMLTMLYTGIRPGELLTIRAENVHQSEHYMTGGIKTAKGKNRKIILPDKLMPVIGYLISNSKRGLLLYYSCADDFYGEWRSKRAELALSEALTPYCCRHTYITNLTALKVSPAMLQELAGHEDYDTTLEYTHLSVADRLAEVNRLV